MDKSKKRVWKYDGLYGTKDIRSDMAERFAVMGAGMFMVAIAIMHEDEIIRFSLTVIGLLITVQAYSFACEKYKHYREINKHRYDKV